MTRFPVSLFFPLLSRLRLLPTPARIPQYRQAHNCDLYLYSDLRSPIQITLETVTHAFSRDCRCFLPYLSLILRRAWCPVLPISVGFVIVIQCINMYGIIASNKMT